MGMAQSEAGFGHVAVRIKGEVEILSRIDHNLHHAPLAGVVGEGAAPHGLMSEAVEAALRRAVFSGMPVVKVGRQ
jgi:hypothetical protein